MRVAWFFLSAAILVLSVLNEIGQAEARSKLNLLEGRAVWSNCRGKRLDSLVWNKYVTAKECVDMGGDCCGTNDDGIGNGSEDPNVMASTDKCYSCYNSKLKIKCTGKLIRSQVGLHKDWWINSSNCIKLQGMCCDGTKTASNPAIFDPHEFPEADFCNNCYSGSVSNTTEANFCTGQMLANNDYTARACVSFGGLCCDNDAALDPSFGGTAFRAFLFPDSKCRSCFDGEPIEGSVPSLTQ